MFLTAASSASTTTVPTWLAVLVPLATVVAALLAGSAGLLGVWLGGSTARETARHAAALAREDEFRRWKRERRYAAYVDLLGAMIRDGYASDKLARVLKRLAENGDDSTGHLEHVEREVETARQRLETCSAEMHNAFSHVLVIGSSEAREAISTWSGRLMAVDDTVIAEDWKAIELARSEAEVSRNALVDVIRRELEVDG